MTPPADLLRHHRRHLVNVLVLEGTAEARMRVAHAFHRASRHKRGRFVFLDAATDHELLDASLQAWVWAPWMDLGSDPLRLAENGTLFLDGVDALGVLTQSLLLRFIGRCSNTAAWEGEEPWWGRLVVGSRCSLHDAVADGRFSADLYDSLDKVRIELDAPVGGRG